MWSNEAAKVVELTDLPPPEPNIQDVQFMMFNGRAHVIYLTNRAPHEYDFVVVEFSGVADVVGGGPNDEAFHNHALARYGLKHYSLQEVVNSPWRRERALIRHKDRVVTPRALALRHFVFSFKEGTFECLAEKYALVGRYSDFDSAFREAAARIIRPLA